MGWAAQAAAAGGLVGTVGAVQTNDLDAAALEAALAWAESEPAKGAQAQVRA